MKCTNPFLFVLFCRLLIPTFYCLYRTRPTGFSRGWAILWCQDLRATSGCMEGSLFQRAFSEMSTGLEQMIHDLIKIPGMNDLFRMSIVYCFFKYVVFSLKLDIQCQSTVGPKC